MDYIIKSQPMLCGSYEAEIRKYRKVIGKSGKTWLYAMQENSAENIYVSASPREFEPGYRGFQGFGGRTLFFTLENGEIEELRAPWQSNSDDLFVDTGVDLRDKHLTFVVIGLGRARRKIENKYYVDVMVDVIYKDEKPTLGRYDRGKQIAQRLANEMNKMVFCYSQSQGGSSSSPIEPEDN